jgi:hypothetical protein
LLPDGAIGSFDYLPIPCSRSLAASDRRSIARRTRGRLPATHITRCRDELVDGKVMNDVNRSGSQSIVRDVAYGVRREKGPRYDVVLAPHPNAPAKKTASDPDDGSTPSGRFSAAWNGLSRHLKRVMPVR